MGNDSEKKVIRDGGMTKSLLVGAVSGAITMFGVYPTFSMKNRAQANLPRTYNPKVLYRGSVSMAMSKGSIIALTFLANDSVRRHHFGVEKMTFQQSLVAAVFSGGLAGTILSLQEFANVRQQMVPVEQRAKNVFDTMFRLTKEHGIPRGFVGMPAAVVRNSFVVASFLALVPLFKDKIKPVIRDDFSASGIAGIITGLCTGLIALPLDVVKTKQQKMAHSAISKEFSFLQISKNVFRQQGIRGFYAGAPWYFAGLSLYVFGLSFLREKVGVIYDNHLLGRDESVAKISRTWFGFFSNKKPTDAKAPDNSNQPKPRK